MAWLVGALLAVAGDRVHAQERPILSSDTSASAPRTVAVVDYVGAEGLYVPVGADAGLTVGDTVPAFSALGASDPSVWLLIVTATRRRAVVRPLDGDLPVVGDTLFLELRSRDVRRESTRRAAEAGAGLTSRAIQQPGRPPRRPDFSGRLALDVIARESRTEWGGDLAGEAIRRYATPTTRLSLYGSDLPGGLELRVSARAAYRYSSDFRGPPPTSVRVYEAAATKVFDAVPLRLTVGRFDNRFESYSGFWDGVLLRVGRRRGLGAGVVAGFEPTRANEAPSAVIPKLTAFVDLSAGGANWGYDGDVSAHLRRPEFGADVRSLGWTQRIRIGRLSLAQRLLLDGGEDGREPEVRHLRIQGALELARGIRLRAAYRHRSGQVLLLPDSLPNPVVPGLAIGARDDVTVGVGARSGRASVAVDGGRTTVDGHAPGRVITVRTTLGLGAARIFASGRLRRAGSEESMSASPGMGLALFGADVRVSWRFYRTRGAMISTETHAIDVNARANLTRGLGVTLGGVRQWGANLEGTSLRFGLWRSF